MEALQALDAQLALWVQAHVRTSLLNGFFVWLTTARHFVIPLAVVWLGLLAFGGRSGRWLALLFLLTLIATDQLSSHLIKPWVDRVRPCFAIDQMQALINQARSPSFPSGHASNSFGAAVILVRRHRRAGTAALLIALLVGISRVYVGVHYPGDVLGGALLGTLTALLIGALADRGRQAWGRWRARQAPRSDS